MKNKGFMLFETLMASTFILGTLIFLYVEFSNVKRNYDSSFKYNTVPGLYHAQSLANFLESDGYQLYVYKLSNNENSYNNGFIMIKDCNESRSSLCKKIVENMDAKNILFVSSNITNLKTYLSKNNYNKADFSEEFKKYINTISTIDLEGRYRLIIEYNNGTFATVSIGVSSADEKKVEYVVNHYLMNLDGTYSSADSSDKYTWIKGYDVEAKTKDYVGFKTPNKQTVTIGDNTVINYYYERNRFDVTVENNDHILNILGNGSYYYGQNVNLIINVEEGYKLKGIIGDVDALDFKMPAKNIKIKPIIESVV